MEEAPKNLLDQLVTQSGMDPNAWKGNALVRKTDADHLAFRDQDADFPYTDRFVNALAVFLVNVDLFEAELDKDTEQAKRDASGRTIEYLDVDSIRAIMREIDALAEQLDERIQARLHEVVRSPAFRELEASWRSLEDLATAVTSDAVLIDFMDVTKEELRANLQDHSAYILNAAIFRKIYVEEYDRYGGR